MHHSDFIALESYCFNVLIVLMTNCVTLLFFITSKKYEIDFLIVGLFFGMTEVQSNKDTWVVDT